MHMNNITIRGESLSVEVKNNLPQSFLKFSGPPQQLCTMQGRNLDQTRPSAEKCSAQVQKAKNVVLEMVPQ